MALASVTALLDFLAAADRRGVLNAELVSHQVDHLKLLIRRTAVSLEEATNAITRLEEPSALTLEQSTDLCNLISQIASNGTPTGPNKNGNAATMQEHNYMMNYLTALDWKMLLGTDDSTAEPIVPTRDDSIGNHLRTRAQLQAQLLVLTDRCAQIGLHYPKELTTVNIVSILLAAKGIPVEAEQAFELVQDFKRNIKRNRSIPRRTPTGLVKYPENVQEFLDTAPDSYDVSDPPVQCPIELALIERTRQRVSARKTNLQVRGQGRQAPLTLMPARSGASKGVDGAPPIIDMSNPQLLLQMLMQTMMGQQGSPHSGHNTANIKIFGQQQTQQQAGLPALHGSPWTPQPLQLLNVDKDEQDNVRRSSSSSTVGSALAVMPVPGTESEEQKDTHTPVMPLRDGNTDKDSIDEMLTHLRADKAGAIPSEKKKKKGRPKGKKSEKHQGEEVGEKKVKKVKKSEKQGKVSLTSKKQVEEHKTRPPMPPPGHPQSTIIYKGCHIYTSLAASKWRVVPKPKEYAYDKAFQFGDNPKASWKRLLDYCENPVIPKNSPRKDA